ncbi:collagen alpha-2(I) chain-like, partial [Poecile atricapillus]|uniref:collagen alpha-2(I) chain-like n=1 Tax=Poecile atricapillus TaxID=48891 RepID=UPI0027388A7F
MAALRGLRGLPGLRLLPGPARPLLRPRGCPGSCPGSGPGPARCRCHRSGAGVCPGGLCCCWGVWRGGGSLALALALGGAPPERGGAGAAPPKLPLEPRGGPGGAGPRQVRGGDSGGAGEG